MFDKIRDTVLNKIKDMESKSQYISIMHQWMIVFGLQIILEVIFLLGSGLGFDGKTLLRIFLFAISSSGIVVSLAYVFKAKVNVWFISIYLMVMIVFAITQLAYKNYMNTFFSIRTALSKAGDVGDYAFDFLLHIRPHYFLVAIPIVLYVLLVKKKSKQYLGVFDKEKWLALLVGGLLVHGLAFFSLSWWPQTTAAYTLQELYYSPTQLESAMRQFGISRFMMRDLLFSLSGRETQIVIIPEDLEDPTDTPVDFTRGIDDQQWRYLAENETNETMQMIDNYLLNRQITPKNEMTGIFKNKNVVFIMVEALDYVAMNDDVAPTMMKMMKEGIFFENYFAPTSACSTGDSELMSITSLISVPGMCNHDEYYTNRFSASLFELFKNDGYYASSYHNFPDSYYMRNIMHRNFGSQAYYDYDALGMTGLLPWPEWPSDVELMEKSLPYFIDRDKFFSFLITVTMHNVYDRDTIYGIKYFDEIKAMYPDYSDDVIRYFSKVREFDNSLKLLVSELERTGKMDDTVIVLFSDHHLLRTDLEILYDYTYDVDREYGHNIHRSPMVIYNSATEPMVVSNYGSTKDLVPTLANLFDLQYDPRVYLGVDIISDEADHVVLLQDGGWIIEQGYYESVTQIFEPNPGYEVNDETIIRYNQISRNLYQISQAILDNNYYNYRQFIPKAKVQPDPID